MRTRLIDKCPACGSGGHTLYAAARDPLFAVEGSWKYLRCDNRACGVLWLSNRPEIPSEPYQNYYTHDLNFKPRKLPRWLRSVLNFLSRWIPESTLPADKNAKTCYLPAPDPQKNKLLEIGCGDGGNLALLKAQGWHVIGQELDEAAANICRERGLPVKVGPLDSLRFEQTFDAIVSNHVLEHMDHQTIIRAANNLLKPGGRLVLITPNAESLAHQLYKSNWIGLSPPFHWTIWTLRALKHMVSENGFSVLEAFTPHRHLHTFLKHSAKVQASGTADVRDYVGNFGEVGAKILELGLQSKKNEMTNGEECVIIGVKP